MNRKEKALDLFRNHCNCSQAVFTAYRQADLLDEETALKLATIFGGGCAGTGSELCGAVNGALLAISMHYGMGSIQSGQAKTETYELGKYFIEAFRSSIGSYTCESILGMNIGKPGNMQKAREMKLFETRCEDAVKTAADILEKMLQSPQMADPARVNHP